jgi:phosphate transport system substrate-binding protein
VAGGGIKEIAISEEPGGECVEPTIETIASGDYPISRPLFIYVSAEAADDPAVAAYVDYYLGEGYGSVEQVGYVGLPDDLLAETTSAWESRTTGTTQS